MLPAKAIRNARIACSIAGAPLLSLSACGTRPAIADEAVAGSPASPSPSVNPGSGLSAAAELGKLLFFDKSLSASGSMSCATCHDPARAYGPSNGLSVQLGGPGMDRPGTRAVPSLRYKEYTPPFADLLDNPDGISAPGPGGGLTWDGRAPTLAEQAKVPLLSAVEMANAGPAQVIARVLASSAAPLFQQVFKGDAARDPEAALAAVGAALQAFQLEDPSFHPYTSKFDRYAGNKIGGDLTPAEVRGLKLFSDANKGNCASCHYQGAGLNGSSAMFTDYSFEAIGVPRNTALVENTDGEYYDLGVCGPARADHRAEPGVPNSFCGMFKTPTLRNVATRTSFFHNGVMHSLEQVLRFYNTRDTRPELWYPTVGGKPRATPDPSFPGYGLIKTQYAGGTIVKYDDLPTPFATNIDGQMPLDGRKAGAPAPFSEQNIADLICFLNTLTDDYQPPAVPPTSGPCLK